ncbi:MAG: hypothetical protein K5924_11610 [Chloroflexi bacterium]|nr:hypothetical protein [Chloroflexota bacterium]
MRTPVLALLAFVIAGCQAGAPPSASEETGLLEIRATFEPPTGDEPISMGGYAYFATVGELVEEAIPVDGTLRVHLPAGTHPLTVVTRPQSDTVSIVDGEEQREVYDISAECEADVEVTPGGSVQVTYRGIGGSECELIVGEG